MRAEIRLLELAEHRLDLLGAVVGVLHDIVVGRTDRHAVRLRGRLETRADGGVGQHYRGEHSRCEFAAAQHAAIVHLGGYPDLHRTAFELLFGGGEQQRQRRPRDRLDHLPAERKPRHRQLVDLACRCRR